jgi:superfamily II DNA or RNA helicase
MRHDILGKPWTWADLSALELTATGSVTEAAGVACPITGHDLTHLPPSELARAHCVDGTKKKCSRLTSKAGYQSWLALSSVERGVRAASLVCAQCGGHPGPAPAWDVPSPPKEGWAPGVRVGWLQGAYLDKKGRVSKKCRVEDTDIVLVSAKSASDCDYPWASFGIGAVAFDEAHRVASPTISQVAPRLSCRYIFGVSATPARLDGSEHALYWLLGPTAFVYKRTAEVTGRRGAVRVRQVEYTRGDAKEVVYRDGRLGFATMVNNLVLDAERNKLILALASDAMVQGRRKILLITSTILHAVLLSRALKAQGFYDTTVLRGGAKPSTVAYAQNPLCRVVVATYHYLAEGYDDAYIDTMILATPRSSVQQAVGRCERTMDGKLVPLVYDVVDDFSLFAGMSRKRHTFYKSRAFAIARETDLAALARMEGGGALPTTDELVPDAEEVEAAARKVAEDECSEEDEFWEEECGEDVCWEEE